MKSAREKSEPMNEAPRKSDATIEAFWNSAPIKRAPVSLRRDRSQPAQVPPNDTTRGTIHDPSIAHAHGARPKRPATISVRDRRDDTAGSSSSDVILKMVCHAPDAS